MAYDLAGVDAVLAKVRIASRAAPVADSPGVVLGAAQSADPALAAQTAASLRWGYQTQQNLQSLDPDSQRQAWSGFNADEQRLLKGMGYNVPLHEGFWGSIRHGLSVAAHDTLGVMGSPLRAVQHVYRAASEVGSPEYTGLAFLSPHDWAQAWSKTSNGQKYLPGAQKVLDQVGLDPAFHSIAMDAAGGMDQNHLVGKYGPDLVGAASTNPKWAQAMDALGKTRPTLGRHFLGTNTYLSGAADAVFDYAMDPVNLPVQSASEILKSRWLVQGADDVDRLAQTSKGFQRTTQMVADQLNSERGVAGVLQRFPQLRPFDNAVARFAEDNAGNINQDTVTGMFKDLASLKGAIDGNGTRRFLGDLPHANLLTPVTDSLKTMTGDSIRWLAEHNVPGARFLTQMSNQWQRGAAFDLMGDGASKIVDQVARMSLPRDVREMYVNSFLAGDLAERHRIWESMLQDTFHSLGSNWEQGAVPSTELERYHSAIMGLSQDALSRPYGFNPSGEVNSVVDTPSGPVSFGIGEHQEEIMRAVPNPKRIAEAARLDSTFGKYLPTGWMDRFMGAWKSSVLMKLNFAPRAGGEEAARLLADEGLMPYLRAQKAILLQKASRMGTEEEGVFSGLRNYLAGKAAYFAKQAGESVAGRWYADAADLITERAKADALPEGIMADGFARAYRDAPRDSLMKVVKDAKSGRLVRMQLVEQGWGATPLHDFESFEMWRNELARFARDPSFQVALEHAGDYPGAERAVYDLMSSAEWAGHRRSLAILKTLQANGMTEDQALQDLARRTTENAFALTHSPAGEPLWFADGIRAGQIPDATELSQIELAKVPRVVAGQKFLQMPQNPLQRLTGWYWDHFVDPGINGISRHPLMVHETAKALKQLEPEFQRLTAEGIDSARTIVDDAAMNMAHDRLIRNIHNPALRSEFEMMHPSISPFFFAHRQWLERWGRTIAENPAAARKAQLLMMGLRHSGMVHTDPATGKDYFFYPVPSFFRGTFSRIISPFLGGEVSFPVDVPLTGQVQMTSAGMTDPLGPGVGPFIGTALEALRRTFPTVFNPVSNVLEGQAAAATRPYWYNFVPAVVSKLYEAKFGPESDAQVGSAINQAMLAIHAAGHDISQTATPEEQQIFLHRVATWARTQLAMRALLGYVAPASPQFGFTTDGLHSELVQLLQMLPIDQAMAEFVRRHPDMPYEEVFQTATAAGAQRPLPVGVQASDWLYANQGFVQRYGAAATWFMPATPSDSIDQGAWQQEMATGLRQRKPKETFWRDIQIASDQNYYYTQQKSYYEQRAQLPQSEHSAIDLQWQTWKKSFLASRPLLQQYINQGGDRAQTRAQVLGQLEAAAQDPSRPAGTDGVANFMAGYHTFQQYFASLSGHSDQSATDQRKELVRQFAAWAESQTDPAALGIYNQLIHPDIVRYLDGTGL